MYTLNEIKKQLVDYFEQHGQINKVVYSNTFDFTAENDILYPVAHIEYLDSSISDKKMNHRFQVRLADLTDRDVPGQHDNVVSDMLQVAEDFFGWLGEHDDFMYSSSAPIKNDSDSFADSVSYINFPLTLSVLRRTSGCAAPTKN